MDTSYAFLFGIASLLSSFLGSPTSDSNIPSVVATSAVEAKQITKAPAVPARSAAGSSGWSTYQNEEYDVRFDYPQDIKTTEEVYEDDGRSVSDPGHISRPYLWFETELPFVTKYDTWTSKIMYMTVEENSAEKPCSRRAAFFAEGENTTINGRGYSYLKSYHTYDSYLDGQKDISEKESVENVALVEYGTKTDSHCYVFGLFLSGTGPYSDELHKIENPSYPSDSEAFFASERATFDKILSTATFSE